jgi:hypothetical protein
MRMSWGRKGKEKEGEREGRHMADGEFLVKYDSSIEARCPFLMRTPFPRSFPPFLPPSFPPPLPPSHRRKCCAKKKSSVASIKQR